MVRALILLATLFFFAHIPFVTQTVYAQKENYNWTFGDSILLNFNGDTPYPKIDTSVIWVNYPKCNLGGGNATISDANGNLLFYLYSLHKTTEPDGSSFPIFLYGKIINKEHSLMENGDGIITGNHYTNGLILPFPQCGGASTKYYLFTLSGYVANRDDGAIQLYRHTIDLSYNGGLGKVVEKNVLMHDYPLVEKLCAVKHANGRDWWIFTHKMYNNEFVRWLLTPDGLAGPFYQGIGAMHTIFHAWGEMLFSNNGKRLGNSGLSMIEVFDFDRSTGLLTDTVFSEVDTTYSNVYEDWGGCAFSPSDRFIYISSGSKKLIQLDLTAPDIEASKVILWNPPDPWNDSTSLSLQELGPDGKIYISSNETLQDFNYNWMGINTRLSVIHYPDSAGAACGFAPYLLPLGHRTFGGLPHFPNYGLGALSPDFSYVLDDFAATFESNVSDLQNYTLHWSFGSGDSSLLANPNYVFPDTGLFTVTLTVSDTSGCFESVNKIIHVSGPNVIDKNWEKGEIKIYPNPSKGYFTIAQPYADVRLYLIDAQGKLLLIQNIPSGKATINVSSLPKGIYYLRLVQNENFILSTEKVVVE